MNLQRTGLIAICLITFATKSFAQQNFFNVPSSDITPKNKLFFQQQINLSNVNIQSNTTFSFGLGKDIEIGVNVLGIAFDKTNGYKLIVNDTIEPFSPFLTINLQKRLNINHHFALSGGLQSGFTSTRIAKSGTYIYTDGVYSNEEKGLKLVAGLYYTSDSFFGRESRNAILETGVLSNIGLQLGLEKNLWNEKLFFQADFISGTHALGEAVVGGAYFFNKNWVISAGYQIPTFNSVSINAIVFELTYVPK